MDPWLIILLVAVPALGAVTLTWKAGRDTPSWVGWLGRSVVIAGWLGLVLLVAVLVMPPAPLAEAELEVGGSALIVPADDDVSLLVHGELPPEAQQHDVSSHWTISVWDGKRRISKHDGFVRETRNKMRIARGRGSTKVAKVHDHDRIHLGATPSPHPLEVRLDTMPGSGPHTLHAAVIPSPPGPLMVVPLAIALVLGGGAADALATKGSAYALGAGFLAATSLFSLDVSPGVGFVDAALRVGIGLVVGTGVGALARWGMRALLARVRGPG